MPARSQKSPTGSDLAILHTFPEGFTRFLESPRARSAKAPGKYPRGAKHPPRALSFEPRWKRESAHCAAKTHFFLRIEYRVGGEAQAPSEPSLGMRHMYLTLRRLALVPPPPGLLTLVAQNPPPRALRFAKRGTCEPLCTLSGEVATLVHGEQETEYHEAHLDAGGLASAVYLYRLTAGGFTLAKKLIVLR